MMREAEIAKYEKAYRSENYRLGDRRRFHIEAELSKVERGSLLDVGCGRGEVLDMAQIYGFNPVTGLEAVPYLCDERRVTHGLVHDMPFADKSFDVVTMFDVMEHLLPDDTESAIKELERVARKTILLTVHNGSHVFQGVELHINRRDSYDDWFDFFKRKFSGRVDWLPRHGSISEMFKVTYG